MRVNGSYAGSLPNDIPRQLLFPVIPTSFRQTTERQSKPMWTVICASKGFDDTSVPAIFAPSFSHKNKSKI